MHCEDTRQAVEPPFVRDESAVGGLPPVALKKTRHDTVTTSAMPNENAARFEHLSKFGENNPIVSWLSEKPKRCEQIEHGVETARPSRRQLSHVAAGVSKSGACAALPRTGQQLGRVIETIDVKARFGEQVCVSALSARHIENARPRRQPEQIEQARHFATITLEGEQGLILEQILIVEVRLPPLVALLLPRAQKNTGSR